MREEESLLINNTERGTYVMKENQCPVCGSMSTSKNSVCPNCGWNFIKDILDYPSVSKVPEQQNRDFVCRLFKERDACTSKFVRNDQNKIENIVEKAEKTAVDKTPVKEKIKSEVYVKKTDFKPMIAVVLAVCSLSQWALMTNYFWQYYYETYGNIDEIGDIIYLPVFLTLLLPMTAVLLFIVKRGFGVKYYVLKISLIILGGLTAVGLIWFAAYQISIVPYPRWLDKTVFRACEEFLEMLHFTHDGSSVLLNLVKIAALILWLLTLMYLPIVLLYICIRCFKESSAMFKISKVRAALCLLLAMWGTISTQYWLAADPSADFRTYMCIVIPCVIQTAVFYILHKLRKNEDVSIFAGIFAGVLLRTAVMIGYISNIHVIDQDILIFYIMPAIILHIALTGLVKEQKYRRIQTMLTMFFVVPGIISGVSFIGGAIIVYSLIAENIVAELIIILYAGSFCVIEWVGQKGDLRRKAVLSLIFGIFSMILLLMQPFIEQSGMSYAARFGVMNIGNMAVMYAVTIGSFAALRLRH